MSLTKSMLDDLLPAKVDYEPLGSVLQNFDRQRKPIKRSSRKPGPYPYYGANGVQDYVEDYLFDGTFLLIGEDGSVQNSDGTPILNWATGKIWVNNHAHILQSKTERLDLRFVYHYLQTIDITSYVTGSTQPKLNQRNMNSLLIPIPPLEVQNEIVRILDQFMHLASGLEVELEAELEARQKQHDFHRGQLLASTGKYPRFKVSQVTDFQNAKAHEKLVDADGTVVLMTARFISSGNADRFIKPENVLTPAFAGDVALVMSDLPNGRALARTFYVGEDGKYAANQRVCLLRSKDPGFLDPKYLHYVMNRNKQLLAYDSGFDQTHLRKDQILDVSLELPPIREQQRIVMVLDQYEALVKELVMDLSTEIAARRQQYKFYRDRLLSFEAASA